MSPKLRGALRSKTVWLGLLLGLTGIVQANEAVFQQYLTPEAQGWFTVAVGGVVVLLRFLTTLPLDEK